MACRHSHPSTTRLRRAIQLASAGVVAVIAATLTVASAASAATSEVRAATTERVASQADGALFSAAQSKQLEVFEFLVALNAADERDAMWDRMAQCETGGNWQDPGQWAGGLGISVGTWLTVGGDEFAPRPDQATRAEQIVVAERIAERFGIHAWGCADEIGF